MIPKLKKLISLFLNMFLTALLNVLFTRLKSTLLLMRDQFTLVKLQHPFGEKPHQIVVMGGN